MQMIHGRVNMFEDIKTPSQRILLTFDFVNYLNQNHKIMLQQWMAFYIHEYHFYGLEFFYFQKNDEKCLCDWLLTFLNKK